MKKIICDVCGDEREFRALSDLGGWMLEGEDSPELCPSHAEELIDLMVKVRDNWTKQKTKQHKSSVFQLVKH